VATSERSNQAEAGIPAAELSRTPSEVPDEADARDRRDRVLVGRAREGNERAFQELVVSYQDRIFGLMLRMIGNRQEAEDLAQDVFITLYRALSGWRGEGRFYTWLYRIASNTCKNRIKYLKGRNFHRSVPVDEASDLDDPRTTPALQSVVPGPEAVLEGDRLERAIQQQLADLDDEQRLLIVLRDIEGLSYQDILRVTGLQEGTLKSRLHRARLALWERLRGQVK